MLVEDDVEELVDEDEETLPLDELVLETLPLEELVLETLPLDVLELDPPDDVLLLEPPLEVDVDPPLEVEDTTMLPLEPPPKNPPPKNPPPNPPKPPLPPTITGVEPPPPPLTTGAGGSGIGAPWDVTVTVCGWQVVTVLVTTRLLTRRRAG